VGIGFGVFIPVFFIVTGMTFDLRGLLANPAELALVPLFLALFFVVRGVPSLAFYRRALGRRPRSALALFAATELPLVVAITSQGAQAHMLTAGTSAAMVGAAMLSVLLLPLLGLRLRRPPAGSSAVVPM
jgi:Kef-type K+ transport system membrane component KefB